MTKKKKDIKMSVPEGMEFNKSYNISDTFGGHSKYYYDFDRNKGEYITFDEKLDIIVKSVTDLLKEKNKAYGDSALNPAGIFSKLNATEALCARIDDKIMRIKNKGINDETEYTVNDLIGYLFLLKMSM